MAHTHNSGISMLYPAFAMPAPENWPRSLSRRRFNVDSNTLTTDCPRGADGRSTALLSQSCAPTIPRGFEASAHQAMGIRQLAKLVNENAPRAVKERKLEELNGRVIAIDASMAIYQFLVRRQGGCDDVFAFAVPTIKNTYSTESVLSFCRWPCELVATERSPLPCSPTRRVKWPGEADG
jgi:XPG N-terminal domain.